MLVEQERRIHREPSLELLSYAEEHATSIDVKDAVESAQQYFSKLIPGASDVRLEEVELSEDERYWHVTLSALIPASVQSGPYAESEAAIKALWRGNQERTYKLFTVDSASGTVKSMKIRANCAG